MLVACSQRVGHHDGSGRGVAGDHEWKPGRDNGVVHAVQLRVRLVTGVLGRERVQRDGDAHRGVLDETLDDVPVRLDEGVHVCAAVDVDEIANGFGALLR